MIQATKSVNCSPIKPPSFKKSEGINTELLENAAEIIRDTGSLKNVNEDTMQKIKGLVEDIEVKENSKVMGPLKTFALSVITLATGTILSRGTAEKLFLVARKKSFVQTIFNKFGKNFVETAETLKNKASVAEEMGKIKKYSTKGLNWLFEKANNFAEKDIEVAKNTPEFVTQKAENLLKKLTQGVGSTIGLTSTGAALAVDKDENGRSDMFEVRDTKKKQKAITDVTSAVLDLI